MKNPLASPDDTADAVQPPRETGTVKRVLLLLAELSERPGAPVSALAQRLNLPRSTVHRLLAMLRESDFAAQRPDGMFTAGAELHRIAGRLRASVPYVPLAEPLLQKLSHEFRETSILAILARQQLRMYYAGTASPPDPMRYNLELHRLEPLTWGATARVLLAHLSAEEVDTVLSRKEPSPLTHRPAARAEIAKAIAEIRAQGYGVTHSHRTPGAVGIAVPFFDAEGHVVGDFGFLIPEARFASHPLDRLVEALREAAARMSHQLGHPGLPLARG